jgi:hypothetical protein
MKTVRENVQYSYIFLILRQYSKTLRNLTDVLSLDQFLDSLLRALPRFLKFRLKNTVHQRIQKLVQKVTLGNADKKRGFHLQHQILF